MSVSMSRKTIEIAHVVIESEKPSSEVRAALEGLMSDGSTNCLKQRLEAAPQLSIFLKRDYGALLRLYGQARDAVQYEIGNSLVASTMMRESPSAGLYTPLRVIVCERKDGGSRVEYDLPSSLFGQFGDEGVTEVARVLDVALGRALSAAAG